MHQNKQTTHEKQNLSKIEQSVEICIKRILLELQNSSKLGRPKKFVYQSREKRIRWKSLFCELSKLIYWVQKFLIFSRINTTIAVSYPKGLTWHFIETKAIKHDYYSSTIMWIHKNSKGKYWVVSQQALFFIAFLARHDDFNDAHIKDKNWNITGASWSIWVAHLSLTHFLCIGILWANKLWEQ